MSKSKGPNPNSTSMEVLQNLNISLVHFISFHLRELFQAHVIHMKKSFLGDGTIKSSGFYFLFAGVLLLLVLLLPNS